METKTKTNPKYLTGWAIGTSAFSTGGFLATGLWIMAAFAVAAAVLTGIAVWLER